MSAVKPMPINKKIAFLKARDVADVYADVKKRLSPGLRKGGVRDDSSLTREKVLRHLFEGVLDDSLESRFVFHSLFEPNSHSPNFSGFVNAGGDARKLGKLIEAATDYAERFHEHTQQKWREYQLPKRGTAYKSRRISNFDNAMSGIRMHLWSYRKAFTAWSESTHRK